ncbi:hypothetical protein BDZ45DRAFT_755210 [Acephala macrosclerotiorum]|nr:hypothetical protein BDZ45DRAFT_755210 [Acephala macrosclerotiorum]
MAGMDHPRDRSPPLSVQDSCNTLRNIYLDADKAHDNPATRLFRVHGRHHDYENFQRDPGDLEESFGVSVWPTSTIFARSIPDSFLATWNQISSKHQQPTIATSNLVYDPFDGQKQHRGTSNDQSSRDMRRDVGSTGQRNHTICEYSSHSPPPSPQGMAQLWSDAASNNVSWPKLRSLPSPTFSSQMDRIS